MGSSRWIRWSIWMIARRRSAYVAGAGLLLCALISCGAPASEVPPAEPNAGRALLEEAAAALRRVETVRYDFRYGGPDDPTGFVTGTTWMRRGESAATSSIRVEGTVIEQPAFGVRRENFEYATDGRTAWTRQGDGAVEVAPIESGGNRLSARGVYGFLPEFVEPEPLWRELSLASTIEREGRERVGGVECDLVRVVIPLGEGDESTIVWCLGTEDRLPRRGRWIAEFSGPEGVVFDLTDLATSVVLEGVAFGAPADSPVAAAGETTVGPGELVPPWSLPRAEGGAVASGELLGEVVVLDFWNTWCPICRSLAPATFELARSYAGRPVRFFGVNLLERNDPVAYWRSVDAPYPTLLEGDDLAMLLDLPWQPGVAVIGPDGTLLHKQFGASADRIEGMRSAIDRGLRAAQP